MKKINFKNNIWKIIWISGVYIVLILILILIIVYKVKWESKDFNTYLYFYNCSEKLCTNTTKPKKYYSKIKCEERICPFIVEQKDYILIMNDTKKMYLYNYKTDSIISNQYEEYYFINNNLIGAKNSYNEHGIINEQNEIVNGFTNNKIKEIQGEHIIQYTDDKKYGIKNVDGLIEILPTYDDIIYIDSKYFAGKLNNKYKIYDYNNKNTNNKEYNYIYSFNGYTIVFYDKKIDILNSKLEEKLIIKINTYYEYITEKEQKTLNIRVEEGKILFNIVNNENKYSVYKLDTKTGKLTQ